CATGLKTPFDYW
nr:immunoglobulin heavy chain junction region [Macaca mulatta]MOW98314.1 immunoglobulin heavy chain junction region [Macaca mulatta]MOW98449.1 immunoglobulin heavy chain junction region [Macaca mulatta]MOW98947.1 immunoglobulin heavy chain junction region [Macaca mulatta]MOW99110.1 immunoglobulin heavy chain junction region [Macaca mulatta]